ncbi:MAG: NFYB/HAP3 family transcription factor subunit [Candidatus Woesearchaeota archaeon]|jgi:histone H3/H4|nr:NFYB/HAP3 family transcription factor subunit [Candidatus Woesearchaeota archaeon]|tara:strand:+ start:97 stop:318 length:222 start_codon:yes stop_codon:yes gene_type:complete
MGRKVTTIPKAPMARILINSGASRVSAEGADVFVEVITKITEEIAVKAVAISKHSGRKTVHEDDVKIAEKQIS